MSHRISPLYIFLGSIVLELALLYLGAWLISRFMMFVACKTASIQITQEMRRQFRWITPVLWLAMIVIVLFNTKTGIH